MIVMFRRRSVPELEGQLREVEERISAHPLASERVVEAQKLVEERNELVEERNGKDQKALSRELSERGLPSLEELGQIQFRNTASWWRLHRDQKRLSRQIQKCRT